MADEGDVKAIRDWLLKQPHLPQALEDVLLARFLHCCDHSLERAKTTLEQFFSLRTESPETFRSRDPLAPEVQRTFDLFNIYYLPELTPGGDRVLIFRLLDGDPSRFSFPELGRMFFMGADTRMRRDAGLGVGVGLVFVNDMSGWSLRHLSKFSLSLLAYYMHYTQEAHPVKLKQFHIINATPLLDKMKAFFMTFVKSDVASLIHTHPVGSNSIFHLVPREILPNELGGLAGPEKEMKENWKKKVEAEREWFLKDEWMADESKRIGKRKALRPDVMEGSFRSLSID